MKADMQPSVPTFQVAFQKERPWKMLWKTFSRQ